jgi:hypothetical protein
MPWTPVTGSVSWYRLASIHRHAPRLRSTSARATWLMIAELASRLAGGHSSAGADRSLSLLAWIQSTQRQEGFQHPSSRVLEPGDDAPRPGIPEVDHAGGFGGHRALDGWAGSGPSFHRAAPSLMLAETIQYVW